MSVFIAVIVLGSHTSIGGSMQATTDVKDQEDKKRKDGTPRPLGNAASQILMAVGYMLLALDVPGSLYIGSIILGLCYGVRLAVLAPIAELFGEKNYGLIYNILILKYL
ncbi:hypothetical protein Q3G72_023074 [Acer saccharum]|nr:hypothetical protein Q3G72_023074 [Acer saccharum]